MGLYEYNEKDLLMIYHTALRNVGLYTSLSFALLGISRFYRKKKDLFSHNVGFIVLSMVFISIAIYIAHNLINDLTTLLIKIEGAENSILPKWLLIPQTIFYMDIVILLFTGYTLYRQI